VTFGIETYEVNLKKLGLRIQQIHYESGRCLRNRLLLSGCAIKKETALDNVLNCDR
jgi:hypothetical protein